MTRMSPADFEALGYDVAASLDAGRAVKQGSATPASAAAKPKPVRRTREWAPYRSKWEVQYALHLDYLVMAGLVLSWVYEPDTLVCAGGTKYRPDFRVRFPHGEEYHEVKGFFRTQDKVRMREASVVSPLPIVLVTKKGGAWHATPYRSTTDAR